MMKTISLLLALSFLLISTPCFGEDVMERTYRSTVYGGITGGLVGGAVMALTDEPDEHFDYILVGAASGIIFGAVYGFLSGTRATHAAMDMNNMEEGFNVPTVVVTEHYSKRADERELVSILNIVRYGF